LALAERDAHTLADENAQKFAGQLAVSNLERGRLLGRAGNLKGAEDLLWREFLTHAEAPAAFWALWELYSHEPCRGTVEAHTTHVPCIVYSPDGRMLMSASLDQVVKLWDVREDGVPELRATLPPREGTVQDAAFGGDGRRVVTCDDQGLIRLWDV